MSSFDKYAEVTKIIKKNISVSHVMGQLYIQPIVVQQLEDYFRRKFNEEKETKDNTAAGNVGTETADAGSA